MAKITRYCIKDSEKFGENVFVVCRPSVFGNPYTHIKDKTTKARVVVKDRNTAIKLYDAYFDEMVKADEKFKAEWDKMYEAYQNSEEIFLGCFCSLSESCHADIIARKLKERSVREMIQRLRNKRQCQ